MKTRKGKNLRLASPAHACIRGTGLEGALKQGSERESRGRENYRPETREHYWQEFWEREHVYWFDPDSQKGTFTIDTPPPTISGALHLGHIYSYTQAEVIARYFRMAGYNVRYPLGFDNNGLPTEKLAEKENDVRAHKMKLDDFLSICYETISRHKKNYQNLFRSVGFSFDWRLEYSTILPETQKLTQTTFKQLYEKGIIYRKEALALYCPECRTSVAQAEVEDQEKDSNFLDIGFKKSDGDYLVISTTRPELLPACVGVLVHPGDGRYSSIVGEEVETPLGDKVKVIADDKVSMEKGTGAVMCCTYGDETDIYWAKKYDLQERIVINREGKFKEIQNLPSLSNASIHQARKIIFEHLKEKRAILGERPIKHAVGVHERCDTPIEILPTQQWFVKILDMKSDLLEAANKIEWYPSYMKKRYDEWVSGLKWDWCISRERFFGIPIPAYLCANCKEIVIPEENEFPINPRTKERNNECPHCKALGLVPETGVLDTWFTSALTSDINNNSILNGRLRGKLYPMSMRSQAHDIIRTWAVYSILMGLYRHGEIPWRKLMISGHVLLRKGEKISKRKGSGNLDPAGLISTNSADALRYAMSGSSLGRDSYYDEREVSKGKKLVTKIYNAGLLVINGLHDFHPNHDQLAQLDAVDRWILNRSVVVAQVMATEFERFEFFQALRVFEEFFWGEFCDNYLEIVKGRIQSTDTRKRLSAQYALYFTFLNILKMASPFVPHITEEMFHARLIGEPNAGYRSLASDDTRLGYFVSNEEVQSIHLSLWPKAVDEKTENVDEGARIMLSAIADIRKHKTANKIRLGETIPLLIIKGSKENIESIKPFLEDLRFVARAEKITLEEDDGNGVADALLIKLVV